MNDTNPTLPFCSHCGHQDTDEVGDHDSMVAACSTCGLLTCGQCWDELHAEECGEAELADDEDHEDGPVLVSCAQCGQQHWYLAETDGMTHMRSLPGFTCGQEDDEEEQDGPPPAVPDFTVWQLARMAGCADPDAWNSIGAKFLVRVETAFIDWIEEAGGSDLDYLPELADGCVPIYTHEVWATFVDLAAYQEDVSELVGAERDLTKAASVALYMVAERLLAALAEAA